MKVAPIFASVMLAFAGCVTNHSQPLTEAETKLSGYPVNGQSAIELTTYFKFMPSLSGYYLRPGIYRAEKEDANGVFFKAPKGVKLLSLTGNTEVDGGIYLPKSGTSNVRGYVYLRVPLREYSSYFLPNKFFSAYDKKWTILRP